MVMIIYKMQHIKSSTSLLVGTDHCHFEITSRQDVKHAVILALIAPVCAGLFRSQLIDRRRFQETATQHVGRLWSRHGALLRVLWETDSLEERGLGVQDLPLLAKSIRIVENGVTVTGNHMAHAEVAHQSDTVLKVLAQTLLNQDGDKVLVGLELDALATTQMHFKDVLLVGGLRVRECESRELGRQRGSVQNTVEVVDSLTLDFENIRADAE
jgi:hypothetical protein